MCRVLLVLLITVSSRQLTFSATIDDLHRLRHHLFSNYTSDVRPLPNQSQPLVIDVDFQFIRIHHIDNTQKEFSIRGILSLAWKDEFLSWKSAEFGGLRHYHPKKGEIWTPSFINGDGVGNQDVMETITRRVLYKNGSVVVRVPGYFSTFCNFDMTYFPFDSQTCNIRLNSLDYFAEELEFRPVTKQVTTIGHYNIHAEWTLVWATMANGQITNATHSYNRLSIIFLVARKPLFAILNIVIPIVTISVLSMMVFLVPVESGEKLSFSLSTLLSLAVFMSFISEQVPASSEKTPLLVIYLTSMVLLNALSVASTVLVLLCYYRGSVDKEAWAYNSSSNTNTTDDVVAKPSFEKLNPLICFGKNKKYMPASRVVNHTLLLLFMGVVIGITIGIMARMTNNT
ncbi:acetylcholine receptor subunit beta-like [Haliotis rubra]|uniref:acetylcholine receptor subunit beta-like n=1 Tax=Haliotis rubra TaxID=36100 RepID=UPI001EE4F274|nr:acetylcholine receptor subunit beta-like [Haliotis rubra]